MPSRPKRNRHPVCRMASLEAVAFAEMLVNEAISEKKSVTSLGIPSSVALPFR